ncbi:hypothetical protein ElyMa_005695100 [Elysia marginata]|uniref:Uncharacterized protein n=1 Tax=Elysia marginata TaxID=1093978 RepID=A0AAV4FG60_9GAST|nr:hypothetical protein ElyMa_005695100 [Elysia marginata]
MTLCTGLSLAPSVSSTVSHTHWVAGRRQTGDGISACCVWLHAENSQHDVRYARYCVVRWSEGLSLLAPVYGLLYPLRYVTRVLNFRNIVERQNRSEYGIGDDDDDDDDGNLEEKMIKEEEEWRISDILIYRRCEKIYDILLWTYAATADSAGDRHEDTQTDNPGQTEFILLLC